MLMSRRPTQALHRCHFMAPFPHHAPRQGLWEKEKARRLRAASDRQQEMHSPEMHHTPVACWAAGLGMQVAMRHQHADTRQDCGLFILQLLPQRHVTMKNSSVDVVSPEPILPEEAAPTAAGVQR